jgi:penicillin-binding protein 2
VLTHLDTGEREETPSAAGHDLRLTIDIALQARVQAVMSPDLGLAKVREWHKGSLLPVGTPLNGAAVVLDVPTGRILAMVTTPSFTREQLRDEPQVIFKDRVDQPWVNRAIGAPYPPGSIVKALMLSGAVTSGTQRIDRTIECTGHLYPDRADIFRCWIYKQFHTTHQAQLGHPLEAPEALMVSCNVFFYTVARDMGPAVLASWYRKFGVGQHWDLGIGPEAVGTLGGPKGEISKGDAIHMGIGQGPVSWTPLHAADAYATLARGGLRITPRINADAPAKAEDLRIDASALAAVAEGLRLAVNERRGTGHHLQFGEILEPIFNAPGVDVWGKTGTAEAPDIAIDLDGAGPRQKEVVREGDHSWFVVNVGPAGKPPRYSIAVIMEYAGSGGRVSGPICNQIIHALIAEGYLPGASQPRAAANGGHG